MPPLQNLLIFKLILDLNIKNGIHFSIKKGNLKGFQIRFFKKIITLISSGKLVLGYPATTNKSF